MWCRCVLTQFTGARYNTLLASLQHSHGIYFKVFFGTIFVVAGHKGLLMKRSGSTVPLVNLYLRAWTKIMSENSWRLTNAFSTLMLKSLLKITNKMTVHQYVSVLPCYIMYATWLWGQRLTYSYIRRLRRPFVPLNCWFFMAQLYNSLHSVHLHTALLFNMKPLETRSGPPGLTITKINFTGVT